MKKFFQMFFVLLVNALAAKRDAQVRFVLAQLAIARKKIPGNRIILDPEDRAMLMRMGEEMNHEVKDTLRLISFKTYQQWFRDKKNGKKPKKSGRPKITEYVIALIVRIAKENWSWGPKRIVGELKKLGEKVSRATVQRVLKEEGLYPDPDRTSNRPHQGKGNETLRFEGQPILAPPPKEGAVLCREILGGRRDITPRRQLLFGCQRPKGTCQAASEPTCCT